MESAKSLTKLQYDLRKQLLDAYKSQDLTEEQFDELLYNTFISIVARAKNELFEYFEKNLGKAKHFNNL